MKRQFLYSSIILSVTTIAAWASVRTRTSAQVESPAEHRVSVPAPSTFTRITPEFAEFSLADAVEHSHDVVHASVVRQIEVEGSGVPYRRVFLQVHNSVRGVLVNEVELHVPGSGSSSDRVQVRGTAWFQDGEELVVFVTRDPYGDVMGVLGLERGVQRVVGDLPSERRLNGRYADSVDVGEFLQRCATLAQPR